MAGANQTATTACQEPTNQPTEKAKIHYRTPSYDGGSKQTVATGTHRLLTSPSDAVYCLISKPHVRFRSDTKQCQRVLRQCPIMDLMDKLIGLEKKKNTKKNTLTYSVQGQCNELKRARDFFACVFSLLRLFACVF